MEESQSMFLSGYAPFSDLLFCAKAKAGTEEVVRDGEFPFRAHVLDGGSWGQYGTTFNWAPIAVASIKPAGAKRTVVAISAQGDFYEIQASEGLEQTGVIPGKPRFIATNLAVVGDTLYALGMGRSIARWDGPKTWTRLDPKLPLSEDGANGFNDLVGFSPKEIYTVGWDGEILRTDGKHWQVLDSPVSAALRAACICSDGMVYAVGYNGTMVRGRGDDWAVIETGRKGVLLDVCAFKDNIYVATAFDVLKLGPDGLEPVTEFEDPEDRPSSCVGLCAAADGSAVLWLGGPDLFRITDSTWHRVPV